MYETQIDQEDVQYEMSNGVGASLFLGRTGLDAGYKRRRALVLFDLAAALPAGAKIQYAEFSVKQTKAAPGSPPAQVGLYRVLSAWGEGLSNALGPEGQGIPAQADDATWHHSLYPQTLWDTAGGDFRTAASASGFIGRDLVRYTWDCTPGLTEDLQYWMDNPGENFGWIMVGGEAAGFSAHRLGSRENRDPESRPRLYLEFSTADEIYTNGFETSRSCGGTE